MKGIIIFEDSNPTLKNIYCINLTNSDIRMDLCSEETYTLTGIRNNMKGATCNKEDSYDFETGALIALMKMCGVEKVKKAAKETFFEVAENSVNEYEEKIHALKEEIKRLKGESENHWKKYQRSIQKKQDRINELQAQIKASEDDKQKNVEYYEKEIKTLKEKFDKKVSDLRDQIHENSRLIQTNGELRDEVEKLEEKNEKLQHEYDLCKNSENALKCSVDYLNKTIAKLNTAIYGYKEDLNKVAERCKELEAENEKLKLDCEKLQHGYIDTDMIFCGGRQNGKQYTALVNMFKKLDQKKVDAAYKEAYNTKLPLWQKEVLNQMYGIYKESKEKIELQGFHIEIKPSTKREEMWNDILSCGNCEESTYVKVKKEDLSAFFKEAEEHKIFTTLGNDNLIHFYRHLYLEGNKSFIFQIFRKPAGFVSCNVCVVKDEKVIDYLPPMRWDLFKKGRLVVKVDSDNYEDFYNKCEVEIGRKPLKACEGTFTVYYKKGTFHRTPYKDTIPFAKKIVDWEDVR